MPKSPLAYVLNLFTLTKFTAFCTIVAIQHFGLFSCTHSWFVNFVIRVFGAQFMMLERSVWYKNQLEKVGFVWRYFFGGTWFTVCGCALCFPGREWDFVSVNDVLGARAHFHFGVIYSILNFVYCFVTGVALIRYLKCLL